MDGGSRRSSFDRYYVRLVEIKYFNVLIDNKQFLGHPVKKKKNKKHMTNLSKCQEMMTIQQGTYLIICVIKIIMNLLVQICQDKQIRVFLKKLIL